MAVVVGTAAAAGGCARSGTEPPAAPPAVPGGCDITATSLRWDGEPVGGERLTRVTFYRTADERATPGAGQSVLDEPFTTAVTELSAPADWTARLCPRTPPPASRDAVPFN